MNNSKLIMMAESIIANFAAYPQEHQLQQTVQHIQQFWTIAMRQKLRQEMVNNKECSKQLQTIVQQLQN